MSRSIVSMCRKNSAVLRIALGGFCFLSCYGIILGAIPAYLVERGYSSAMIGIVVGSYAIGLLAFRLTAPRLIDRIGPRWAAVGAAIAVAVSILINVVTIAGLDGRPVALLIISRILHGGAVACYYTAALAAVSNSGPPTERGRRVGMFSAIAGLSLVLWPPIGVWLYQQNGALIVWSLPLFAILVAVFLLPGDRPEDVEIVQGPTAAASWSINALVMTSMAAFFVAYALQGGAEAHTPMIARTYRAGNELVLLYVVFGVSVFVGRVLGGGVGDRLGHRVTIMLCLGVIVCACAVPIFSRSAPALVIAAGLLGLGSGAMGTAVYAYLVSLAPPDAVGHVLGRGALAAELGLTTGAVVTGGLINVFGAVGFYVIGLVLTLLCLAAFVGTNALSALGRSRWMASLTKR
jgi:MFS family permease